MPQESLFQTEPNVESVLAELWKVPGWPQDRPKDEMYVRDLLEQFPDIDLVEEVRGWRAWMLDHKSRKRVQPRARFRNWCCKSREFRASRAASRRSRPASAEAHGATSDRLEQW